RGESNEYRPARSPPQARRLPRGRCPQGQEPLEPGAPLPAEVFHLAGRISRPQEPRCPAGFFIARKTAPGWKAGGRTPDDWRSVSGGKVLEPKADLGSHVVDGVEGATGFHVPEGPAIARGRALHLCPDAVDRARMAVADDGAVGAHGGAIAPLAVIELGARRDQTLLDQRAEGDARFGALGACGLEGIGVARLDRGDAFQGRVDIVALALDADEVASELLGHGAGCARAAERLEND